MAMKIINAIVGYNFFYKEEKKVSNTRLKDELKYKLTFPSFKEGLSAIHINSIEF